MLAAEPNMTTDCDELHARADMLHREADLSLQRAEEEGPHWLGFSDQVSLALRCEGMALQVRAEIEEEC